MDLSIFQLALLSALVLLPVTYNYLATPRPLSGSGSLPPGPPSSYLYGTPLSPLYPWKQFDKWKDEYGGVFRIYRGGRLWSKPFIVAATLEDVKGLLEKDSAKSDDRPKNIFASEYLSGGMRILLIGHGDRWKRLRKMLHQGLQPKMAASFEPLQEKNAIRFMNDLLETPDDFVGHAKSYAAAVVMTLTYHKQTPTRHSDADVQLVEKSQVRLGQCLRPGAYLVDTYHFLRYFPGKWKKQARDWHQEEVELFGGQLDKVRDDIKNGRENEGFARFIIEHQEEYRLSNNEAAYLAGSIFGAGSHTTAATIAVAIMAATTQHEAVTRAQQELDRVVGRGRLPTWNDQVDLPYVRAFVKEVFRWRPIAFGGFPHATVDTIAYKGYIIPSGSTIIGNIWSISRDPAVFTDVDRFLPERWLNEEGDDLKTDVDHVGYGFGRRACAGKHVADRSILINTLLLLWAFSFSKKKDFKGEDIEIDTMAFTNAMNSEPLPFKTEIRPRFDGVSRLLKEAALLSSV